MCIYFPVLGFSLFRQGGGGWVHFGFLFGGFGVVFLWSEMYLIPAKEEGIFLRIKYKCGTAQPGALQGYLSSSEKQTPPIKLEW